MRRIAVIANRGAGSFSQQQFDMICAQLDAAEVFVQNCFCSDFAEMTEKAHELSSPPDSPIVVAAGGDGTINAVLNGLAGNRATCAILPLGTANVMAIELGVAHTGQAVSRLVSGIPRPFTAGLLKNSAKASRFFLMAGAGFDGHIVRAVSLAEKKRYGKGAYVLSALRSLVSWDSGELRVTTEKEAFSCGSLIVCNASRYGGSFSLAPAANIFSPSFELIAIKRSSRSAAIRAIADAAAGRADTEWLHRTTAARIRILGVKPVQADGDDWGDAPVEILAEPNYASILF